MENKENENFTERLTSLKIEIQSYEKDIKSQIQHLYTQHLDTKFKVDLKGDPRNAVKILHQDVLELLEEAREKSVYLERLNFLNFD